MRGEGTAVTPGGAATPWQWGWLLLLTSSSALVCCAIPIALVALGLGVAVASLYGSLPFLGFLSVHKQWVFGVTAILLALAAWALYRPGRTCPSDPELARACNAARKWNRGLFWASATIWGLGIFAAFLLLPLAKLFGLL